MADMTSNLGLSPVRKDLTSWSISVTYGRIPRLDPKLLGKEIVGLVPSFALLPEPEASGGMTVEAETSSRGRLLVVRSDCSPWLILELNFMIVNNTVMKRLGDSERRERGM